MIKFIKQLPLVLIALFLIAISINMFLAPHQIASGGVSGIGVLLEFVTGINRSVTVLVLNLLMLVLAFFFLGRLVFVKCLIGSILLPVVLAIVPEIMPVEDRFLSVIVGSSIFAVGVDILYRNEASSGGTTIPPLIMKKYFGINTSIGLLATDMVVVIFNVFVFGLEAFFFAVLSLIITSMVMNYLETGINRYKAVMITSNHSVDDIRQGIAREIESKTSVFKNADGQTLSEGRMLLVMVDDRDYPNLIHIVDRYDKDAFIVTYNVAGVHGKGQFVKSL